MEGSILSLAKRDAKRFVTSGGFQVGISLSTPDRSVILPITGYATKHWINFDTDGLPVNGKNAHISIDENILIANNYPLRNNKNEVHLKGHIVSFADSTGIVKNYSVRENYPDETLGLIVLILQDFTL